MTQATKEPRDQSQAWADSMREKRNFRWGRWIRGIIWTVLFVIFVLVFFLHNIQAGGLSAIVSVLVPSSPSVTIVAKNDLSGFTLLTRANIEIVQGNQEKNPSLQDTASIKKLEEAFYQRLTLYPYSKGEEIQLSDLGPKLPNTRNYQIREIKASASLAWIQVGDTLTFTLFNTLCSSGENVPKTNAANCAYRPDASPLLLKDVVIVRVGRTSQEGGLVALLIAVPLEENTGSVTILNLGGSTIVAYPVGTITNTLTNVSSV